MATKTRKAPGAQKRASDQTARTTLGKALRNEFGDPLPLIKLDPEVVREAAAKELLRIVAEAPWKYQALKLPQPSLDDDPRAPEDRFARDVCGLGLKPEFREDAFFRVNCSLGYEFETFLRGLVQLALGAEPPACDRYRTAIREG